MKTKTGKKRSSITEGSGNVFADMGVPEPEQALAKAKLAAKIAAAIEEEDLTQMEAVEPRNGPVEGVGHRPRPPRPVLDGAAPAIPQMIGYDVEIRSAAGAKGRDIYELARNCTYIVNSAEELPLRDPGRLLIS